MGVCGWAMSVPAGLAAAVHSNLTTYGHLLWPTILLLAIQPVLLLGLFWRRLGRAWLIACGWALFIGIVGWMPHREELPINQWAPGYWVSGWACWAVTLLPRRQHNAIHVTMISTLMALDVVLMHHRGVPLTGLNLAPIFWFGVPIALITLFGQGILDLADLADHQARRRLVAQRSEQDARAEADAHREAARLLHDHVLHALQAIGRSSTVPARMVIGECRDAVDAISRAGGVHRTARLEDLLSDDPLLTSVGAHLTGSTDRLPSSVAQAMAAATHEALSNVARHSRSDRCTVETSQDGAIWRVVITDDGRGFHPERLTEGRLGLRRSVHERLEDVGGLAQVTSSPGQGTRVELQWPVVDAPQELPRMGSAPMRRLMARTAWPGVLVTLAMIPTVGPLNAHHWALEAAAMWACLVIAWFVHRLTTHELTPAGGVVLLATAEALWWFNLWVAPDHPTTPYYLWLGWTCTTLLRLVVLQVNLRASVLLMAGWAVGQYGALWIATGTDGLLRLNTSVTTGLGECILTLVALVVARRVLAAKLSEEHLAEAMRHATARHQVEAHVEQFWSKRVTGVALPLLRDVADGRRDVDDPYLRAQAVRLEATLRDELVLGPGHTHLLISVSRLRSFGWQVQSSLSDEVDPAGIRPFCRLLDELGLPSPVGQAITLSSTDADATALVLAPTPGQRLTWDELATRVGARLDGDTDFVRLTLPLTSPERHLELDPT